MTAASPNKRGLRLFMSVDIAGSTQFKARFQDEKDGYWVDTFQDFFSDFPLLFAEKLGRDVVTRVRPWKMLGDEINFVASIGQFSELQAIIYALYAAMTQYREVIRANKGGLDLKATAWTASFPYRNKVVEVPTPEGTLQDDYLGPDVDTGFRLTNAAIPGPITASMDVADLFLREHKAPLVRCLLVGWQKFKGVHSNEPYPVYWLVPQEELEKLDFLPWAHETSDLVRGYIDAKKLLHSDSRPKWYDQIADIRHALNERFGHALFAPYYWPESLAADSAPPGMPEEHQERLRAESRPEGLASLPGIGGRREAS